MESALSWLKRPHSALEYPIKPDLQNLCLCPAQQTQRVAELQGPQLKKGRGGVKGTRAARESCYHVSEGVMGSIKA